MLATLPALAYHFGIRPWEIELLTYNEIAEFTEAMEELTRAQQSASKQK